MNKHSIEYLSMAYELRQKWLALRRKELDAKGG